MIKLVLHLISFGFSYLMVSWLVDGGFWLHFYLAAGAAGSTFLSTQLYELGKQLQLLNLQFNIADNQLVKVSAMADDYEEQISDLQNKVLELESKIQESEWRG